MQTMFGQLANRLDQILSATDLRTLVESQIQTMSGNLQKLVAQPLSGDVGQQWINDAKKIAVNARKAKLEEPIVSKFEALIQQAEKAVELPQRIKKIEDEVMSLLSSKKSLLLTDKADKFLEIAEQKAKAGLHDKMSGRFFSELLGAVEHVRKEQAKQRSRVTAS